MQAIVIVNWKGTFVNKCRHRCRRRCLSNLLTSQSAIDVFKSDLIKQKKRKKLKRKFSQKKLRMVSLNLPRLRPIVMVVWTLLVFMFCTMTFITWPQPDDKIEVEFRNKVWQTLFFHTMQNKAEMIILIFNKMLFKVRKYSFYFEFTVFQFQKHLFEFNFWRALSRPDFVKGLPQKKMFWFLIFFFFFQFFSQLSQMTDRIRHVEQLSAERKYDLTKLIRHFTSLAQVMMVSICCP